jgi:hypothetical protein
MAEPLVYSKQSLEALGKHAGFWHAIMPRTAGASSAQDIATLVTRCDGVDYDMGPEPDLDALVDVGGVAAARADMLEHFHTDMAYHVAVCTEACARAVVDDVLDRFDLGSLAVYVCDDCCTSSGATFDRGYVFIDDSNVGVLVIADED